MDDKSDKVEVGTVEIENSCAKLSLTGAFDFPEQIISYADLDKQERGLVNLSHLLKTCMNVDNLDKSFRKSWVAHSSYKAFEFLLSMSLL